jgi:hypothetical protein
LIQNHRGALVITKEKIAELEMEKIDSIQEHQDVLATTEEAVEKKIANLEKKKAELI